MGLHHLESMATREREMGLDCNTRRLRPVIADKPLGTSQRLGWEGVTLEHYRVTGFETGEIAHLKHTVTLLLSGSMTIEWREEGRTQVISLRPGNVSIVPAHLPFSCRSKDAGEFVTIHLDPRFLLLHCPEPLKVSAPRLQSRIGASDPFLAGVCQALLNEIGSSGPSGRIYAETLATGMAAHLAGSFGGRNGGSQRSGPAATRREVRQAMTFIQENLEKDFSLSELAAAVNLSPFYFSRIFKKATGHSPYQFVLRQRIQRARQLLLAGQDSIATVAIKVGFCDQSHFSAHFKRVCGVTPKHFADRHGTGVAGQ